MSTISVVFGIAYVLIVLYFFVMWARFILDLASNFSREWRPKGFGLVLAEIVFTLTDPPLRIARRIIPRFRVGPAAVDFSWAAVMLVVIILMYTAAALSSSAG